MIIKYKEFEFEIITAVGDLEGTSVIVSLDSDDDDVSSFNDEVFFEEFVGIEYDDGDSQKIERRIKRAFSKYLKQPKEEAMVENNIGNEPSGPIDKIIFDTVSRALGSNGVKSEIDGLIKELITENGVIPFRKVLEVKRFDGKQEDVGLQHYEFERTLQTIAAGVPIALVGPAGSGKTTIVYNASKALGLEFSSESVSAQSTKFDFFGFKNAKGEYVTTLFRERYEKGGVYLLDEFDAGNPNVLAALNQATANSVAPFADKMVEKHKDFIIVMAGNTYGGGGTIDYVGRNKIDAATLDRFAFVYIGYDESLEMQIATNKEWCERVQSFRRTVEQKKVRTIISPRATFNGEKLLANGIPQDVVEEMVIYKGMSEDERNLISLY